ncbi:hypothetical protein [Streptomyces sp. NPDC057579]|uniref:hypothetical protein n=1 Tax=Streptomyces sp. NPDC057579 TaxID=3346172 RepID=UPI0036935204
MGYLDAQGAGKGGDLAAVRSDTHQAENSQSAPHALPTHQPVDTDPHPGHDSRRKSDDDPVGERKAHGETEDGRDIDHSVTQPTADRLPSDVRMAGPRMHDCSNSSTDGPSFGRLSTVHSAVRPHGRRRASADT